MASRSSKGKIVYLFSFMVMILTVLCALSVQQLNKSEQTRRTDEVIENIHSACLNVFKTDVDFFAFELNNNQYYKSSSSPYLEKHDSLLLRIEKLITVAKQEENISIDADLQNIQRIVLRYDSVFRKVAKGILVKGFEQFGLEGEIRKNASILEEQHAITDRELLTLRNYEKEYLLTYDSSYVELFNNEVKLLESKYSNKPAFQKLVIYSESFHDLIKKANEIGLETQSGLKGVLNIRTNDLIKTLTALGGKSDSATEDARQNGVTIFLFAVIIGIIFCVIIIFMIIRKL